MGGPVAATPDKWTELAKSHGIKTYVSHPLTGPGGTIIDTLFFGARHRKIFSNDDLSLIRAVADQLAVAVTRMDSERALKERSEELAEVNKELEAFSYTVSHDLRTPLRSIEGFTTAIIEDHGPGLERGAKKYLNRVIDASRRMGQQIDAMLNMARLTEKNSRKAP